MIASKHLLFSNIFFRVGISLAFLCVIVASGALVAGHLIIGKIVVIKNEILDLSEPATGKRYRRLIEDYNTTKDERQMLVGVRPTRQEIAYFVQAIDGLAGKTQVMQTVEVVTQKNPDGEAKYAIPAIRYDINVIGNLSAVINFMKEVDKMPYLLRFVSLRIKAPEDKNLSEQALGNIIVDIAAQE